MKQLRTLEDLSLEQLEAILYKANQMETALFKQGDTPISVANLFFEPSTRTKCSFEMAQKELGLHSLQFDVGSSSVQKGETLYDTIKTLETIGCKAVVVRHPEKAYYDELDNISIPIINAGDGAGDHPTQSLLDLLTIQQEFVIFQGVHVVICGDIRHSRVARTNANILRKLGAKVSFAGPEDWMDESITQGNVISMDDAVKSADVMMMLRIQTERHGDAGGWSKKDYHDQFGLTVDREKMMRNHAIIMHPAPVNRDVELASELVECTRSRIFKQMRNGVLVRKAVLAYVLDLMEVKTYERAI
ncbi:aspartate carbamoyltransferase catalytic subunit [Evansella cellulosilytica]|uniref:Aspartate carbamoyltransferase n=1 Tax=Evansella cellulosilytica (strain ATCC 21833 / DSM 2522 / FERM P-1141 / JCM 9156 / N-4) TaxID=649639 RepID=E6TTQ8_EVAC2|nr:aspartate carbamoyltransferase catalytic subunit [Evansella cellulosilytica]ADU30827.1 aspartate carbamoyltransferase [Evansella cellulosilytica DSM 2522]